jgi:hypothetical protein
MEAEKRPLKLLNKKTFMVAIMLGILLMQLIGCAGTSANPGTSSSSGSSSGSLSAEESEAETTAIDAWIVLLNAHQRSPQAFLNTSITSSEPSKVGQELNKGNTVTVKWEALDSQSYSPSRTVGEAQIKNFVCQVTANGLSPADSANGITWKGTVNFAYVMRYRGIISKGDYSHGPSEIRPLSDQQPFSPWIDTGTWGLMGNKKIIVVSPASFSVIKQNGKWTAPVFNPLTDFGNSDINCPLPGIPYFDYYSFGWGTNPYLVIQTAENQSAPISSVQAATASTDQQLVAQAQQLTQGKPQPEKYSSCLVYAQARSLGVTAKGNTGAFNILYQGNDAKLVNNLPTAQLKSGLKPLQNISNLTTVLQSGDFIIWQRGIAGADSDYGHIAVVELVESGRIVISQAGWSPTWKVLQTRDFVSGMYGYSRGLP